MSSDPPSPAAEELAVKATELEVRRLEAKKSLALISSPWWRRTDPLALAILAGALTLFGNMIVAVMNSHSSLTQEQSKAHDDLVLEQTKAKYNLVLQAMATNDAAIAKRNIHFFIDAGLLQDPDCKIRYAIDQDQPVLPALSGTAPPTPAGLHSAPEIATVYNFPSEFDGRGVTIGIIELDGSVVTTDLAKYFESLKLPPPEIASVSVDGAAAKPNAGSDAEVMMSVEIIGAIAPRARIRVYFAPNTSTGFAHAIRQATSDGVAVLLSGWGSPESVWKDEDIKEIDAALQQAALQNVTVVAAAGDGGATDRVSDGRRHVDFPASSPWVLAVGGTSLKTDASQKASEKVWQEGDLATGGGVSEKFARPDWQSAVPMPARDNGSFGRGIPDVVASADPALGITIIVHGQSMAIGGTGSSAALWVGLIARIDQALGYNIGYLNPRLYQEIGPQGIFRPVISGDNTVGSVKGYSAAKGWSPVAGWGSPDGVKLLTWLREHPSSQSPRTVTATACQPAVAPPPPEVLSLLSMVANHLWGAEQSLPHR